jgi:hypothetical protein
MFRKLLLLSLMGLLGSCVATASESEPPSRGVRADMNFPAPDTRWVARFVTQTGTTATITYTVLGEGTYDGKPVYRVSGGFDTQVYDKATGNLVAILWMGKEANAFQPHEGMFSWPLYLGKSWTASYTAHDRQRGMSVGPIKVEYRVAAYEDVVVPAGSWKAFRIESESGSSAFSTIWYAPEISLIVKKVNETIVGHPLGRTKSVYEIIEYPAKDKTLSRSERRPIAGSGARAEKPEWQVGYEWRYAWKGPKGSGTLSHEIVREDIYDEVLVWVIRAGRNENFYSKSSLGLLATLSGGKPISRRNATHDILSWPLEPGKEWNNTYILERPEEKSSQKLDLHMIVASVEEIKVPAGTFEAFKTEVYNNFNGKLLSEHWYSPKVRWLVKSKTYLMDGVREEELISYKTD